MHLLVAIEHTYISAHADSVWIATLTAFLLAKAAVAGYGLSVIAYPKAGLYGSTYVNRT